MRRWALTDAEGRVLKRDLMLPPERVQALLEDLDGVAPQRAPHYVALAGGDA